MLLLGSAKTLGAEERDRLTHAPGSAASAGDFARVGGSILGFYAEDVEANRSTALELASAQKRWVRSASATTFSIGDEVWWDASAAVAIPPGTGIDPSTDEFLGIACKAKVNGQNGVLVIPADVLDRYNVIRPTVVEFDCEADTADRIAQLIPAWQNRHGLCFVAAWGLVTEVFAGGDQDQGIVTIEDSDGNDIATLTPSDAGADAAGDVVLSSISLFGSATGVAWKTVAAGKALQAKLTQKTSGAGAAGKMKVYVLAVPLL